MPRPINKVIRKKGKITLNEVLRAMKETSISVGVHSGESRDGLTIAYIAAQHEFGNENVPERSFLRSTFRDNIKNYKGNMTSIVNSVLNGKYTVKVGMGRLGRQVEQDVKSTITGFINPPLAPETLKKKNGKSTPLIDTSQMINSIRWEYANKGKVGI